jgi:HSP20 family molecular chaperone IbpA
MTSSHTDPLGRFRPIPADELGAGARPGAEAVAGGPLAYDVLRRGSELVIEFDVPGAGPDDVTVDLDGRWLQVSVRRRLAVGDAVDVVEANRQHGVFGQRLFLDDAWGLDGAVASVHDGVLTFRAPVVAQSARRLELHRPDADETGEDALLPGEQVLVVSAA